MMKMTFSFLNISLQFLWFFKWFSAADFQTYLFCGNRTIRTFSLSFQKSKELWKYPKLFQLPFLNLFRENFSIFIFSHFFQVDFSIFQKKLFQSFSKRYVWTRVFDFRYLLIEFFFASFISSIFDIYISARIIFWNFFQKLVRIKGTNRGRMTWNRRWKRRTRTARRRPIRSWLNRSKSAKASSRRATPPVLIYFYFYILEKVVLNILPTFYRSGFLLSQF